MNFIKKFIILIGLFLFLMILWFYSINSPFSSDEYKFEVFNFQNRTLEEYKLANSCYGFSGICNLETIGLKLELNFSGFSWNKPYPNFLNISGWGDNKGWSFSTTYYGYRVLSVFDVKGNRLTQFKQLLWNTRAYSDFGQVIAFDLPNRKLFVSSRQFGFNSVNEEAFVVQY